MEQDIHEARAPGLFRRLAAMLYDLVLLFGLLMIAVTLVVVPYDLLTGAPFPHEQNLPNLGLRLYLIGVICLFYIFFWTRGGQTLGMRSWRFRLLREDGSVPNWRDASVRLVWAALCLSPVGAVLLWMSIDRSSLIRATLYLVPAAAGFLWMLVDRDRLTCYDRLSRTRPVMLTQ